MSIMQRKTHTGPWPKFPNIRETELDYETGEIVGRGHNDKTARRPFPPGLPFDRYAPIPVEKEALWAGFDATLQALNEELS